MADELIVDAVYEDGVFKPAEPLNLVDKQQVKLKVTVPTNTRQIVKLRGVLANVWGGLDYEALDAELKAERQKSLDRLLRQVEGDFGDDDK